MAKTKMFFEKKRSPAYEAMFGKTVKAIAVKWESKGFTKLYKYK